jgi:hypothetical protein
MIDVQRLNSLSAVEVLQHGIRYKNGDRHGTVCGVWMMMSGSEELQRGMVEERGGRFTFAGWPPA